MIWEAVGPFIHIHTVHGKLFVFQAAAFGYVSIFIVWAQKPLSAPALEGKQAACTGQKDWTVLGISDIH